MSKQEPIYTITTYPWGARVTTKFVEPADKPSAVGDYKGRKALDKAKAAVEATQATYTVENW